MLTFAGGRLLRKLEDGSTRMGREVDRSIWAVAIGLLTRKAWYRRIVSFVHVSKHPGAHNCYALYLFYTPSA